MVNLAHTGKKPCIKCLAQFSFGNIPTVCTISIECTKFPPCGHLFAFLCWCSNCRKYLTSVPTGHFRKFSLLAIVSRKLLLVCCWKVQSKYSNFLQKFCYTGYVLLGYLQFCWQGVHTRGKNAHAGVRRSLSLIYLSSMCRGLRLWEIFAWTEICTSSCGWPRYCLLPNSCRGGSWHHITWWW